jgi:hypothetical protein
MSISLYAESLLAQKARAERTPAAPQSAALAHFPLLMKISQVAAYLAVSADQVSEYRDTGDLEFINVATPGSRRPAWRITRSSLAAFEKNRQLKPKK